MRLVGDDLHLSASDLSSFLGCRHRAGLDQAVAHGLLTKPEWDDPFALLLRMRGEEHERAYLEKLRKEGRRVVELEKYTPDSVARTLAAMREGVDVIAQANLSRNGWTGYADVLMRVDVPSPVLGAWSYEVHDTKLARETKGGTILQLAIYSELLGEMQGLVPEWFRVITPDPEQPIHSFRVDEYAAYYRLVRAQLLATLPMGPQAIQDAHYPEPVEHCDVCRWFARCDARRRADDHLSFIAGIGRSQRVELVANGVPTLAAAAAMPLPVPFKPVRGSVDTYTRIREQARLQVEQRESGLPRFERLPVQDDESAKKDGDEGLRRLPTPSVGDLFLDLEGARFAREGGREYLFGVWGRSANTTLSPS